MWPRVPLGFSDRTITFRLRLPTCGDSSSLPSASRAPLCCDLQGFGQRDPGASDRRNPHLLSLGRVAAAALVRSEVPCIGNHHLVASSPAFDRLFEDQHGSGLRSPRSLA